MAGVSEIKPLKFPSSQMVRRLNIAAAVLTAAAIAAQAGVEVLQQTSKSKTEKAGLESAVRLSIAVTLAKAVPSLLSQIRTISTELRR
jgi:hypothetical protein